MISLGARGSEIEEQSKNDVSFKGFLLIYLIIALFERNKGYIKLSTKPLTHGDVRLLAQKLNLLPNV